MRNFFLSFFLLFSRETNWNLREKRIDLWCVNEDRRIGGLFRWSRRCMAMMRLWDGRVVHGRIGLDLHDSTIKIEIVRLWERESLLEMKKTDSTIVM